MKGRFDQMIVFRHSGGELPIDKYLKEVILDDPRLSAGRSRVDYYSMAYGALKLAMTEGQLDVPISKRTCRNSCRCLDNYKDDRGRTAILFIPRV